MARPLRIEFPGAIYHLTSRGNARQAIFSEDRDYRAFLKLLCAGVARFHWILHAYVLMPNHYHLLVETPDTNLSRGMRHLNGVYTQRFNWAHSRAGHLLQGRFHAVLVEKDTHLLELCRYLVLNPVRAGLVKRATDWPWSSYQQTLGQVRGLPCLTTDWVLSQFGSTRSEAAAAYQQFVAGGLAADTPWRDLKAQVLLGGDAFVERLAPILKGREVLQEVPRTQRYAGRPRLDKLVSYHGRGPSAIHDRQAFRAHVHYGYTLKEIARFLGVHYATVSRAVHRAEASGAL